MFLAWGVMVCLSHVLRVHEIGGDTGPCRERFFSYIGGSLLINAYSYFIRFVIYVILCM